MDLIHAIILFNELHQENQSILGSIKAIDLAKDEVEEGTERRMNKYGSDKILQSIILLPFQWIPRRA
jgi:hypothetical protein